MATLAVVAAIIVWAWLWVSQVAEVMLLPDPDPPGRSSDKLLWVALFVLAPPLAPGAFLIWKRAAAGRRAPVTPPEKMLGAPGEVVAWAMVVLVVVLLVTGWASAVS